VLRLSVGGTELHLVRGEDPRSAAHALLRELLTERLGVEPRFGRDPCPSCGGPHGRPSIVGLRGAPQFSLSSTNGAAIVAIAPVPIGVDIERIPDEADALETVTLLHPCERREIERAPSGARAASFARIWTRKEAYLKGVGVGVATDLAADDLSGARAPAGWEVLDVAVTAGYAAAVAVRSSPRLSLRSSPLRSSLGRGLLGQRGW
jgi:4'-phosphopantetheinyl transferase